MPRVTEPFRIVARSAGRPTIGTSTEGEGFVMLCFDRDNKEIFGLCYSMAGTQIFAIPFPHFEDLELARLGCEYVLRVIGVAGIEAVDLPVSMMAQVLAGAC